MSILFVGLGEQLGHRVITRLLGQGDEVRVIEEVPDAIARLKEIGAFVARGVPDDPDLVERAAQNVRTIVVTGAFESLDAALDGARSAGVDRVVVCHPAPDKGLLETVRASGLDYVIISFGRREPRAASELDALAEAIDAADDLSGAPRLEVDLRRPETLLALGVGTDG